MTRKSNFRPGNQSTVTPPINDPIAEALTSPDPETSPDDEVIIQENGLLFTPEGPVNDEDDPGINLNERAMRTQETPKPTPDPVKEAPRHTPQTLEDLPPTRTSSLPSPEHSSLTHAHLDQAADYLLTAVTQYVRDSIKFQAAELRIPRWQLVCGLIVQLHQSGGLSNPSLDPAWASENPVALHEATCQNPECAKAFAPKWRGQLYCTRDCGSSMDNLRIEAIKKAHADEARRDAREAFEGPYEKTLLQEQTA